MSAAGFVLVGGHSSRMGRDKALLSWGSQPLIEQLGRQLEVVAGSVALVGEPNRYQSLGFDCIPDLRPGLGPLAGIEAALLSGRAEWNLIVACDLPGLKTEVLTELIRVGLESHRQCAVVRDSTGIVHPLCAIYHNSCLEIVQNALDKRLLKLQNLVEHLDSITVGIDSELSNVNTPDEWSAWQRAHNRTENENVIAGDGD